MTVGSRLREVSAATFEDPGWTPVMRERMEAERARWVKQLDEATEWMVDNVEIYGLSWPTEILRTVIGQYVLHARAVMLSERQDDRKAELLVELTKPVWDVFAARLWQANPRRLPRAKQRLEELLAEIGAEADRQNPEVVPAA
ncbi:hypothetical protein ACFYT4_31535 [Streptomyces sp. NPDC004609]|uniref:hypothetical protein n=1 Tax=Streptomyces sp. NPDC004609 TaxID=3364704 RepID=UPI0036C029A1